MEFLWTVYTLSRRETLNLMGGGFVCRPFILCYDATLNLMGGGFGSSCPAPVRLPSGSLNEASLVREEGREGGGEGEEGRSPPHPPQSSF